MVTETEKTAANLGFVVGSGRSGTSLLRAMVSMSPEVAVPPETHFYQSISGTPVLLDEAMFEKAQQLVVSRWWIRDMDFDRSLFFRLCDSGSRSWDGIFLALLTSCRLSQEASHVVEKTPSHLLFLDRIFPSFPQARVVHVMRDPRAVVNSYRKASVGPNTITGCAELWAQAAEAHLKFSQGPFSSRYLMVWYEDLIADPNRTLKTVCEFLDFEVVPAMLNFAGREDVGFSPEQVHHWRTQADLDESRINAWKHDLSELEVGMIEQTLEQPMHELSIERSTKPTRKAALLSSAERSLQPVDLLRRRFRAFRKHRKAARRQNLSS